MKYIKTFEKINKLKVGDIVRVKLRDSGYFYGIIDEYLDDFFIM